MFGDQYPVYSHRAPTMPPKKFFVMSGETSDLLESPADVSVVDYPLLIVVCFPALCQITNVMPGEGIGIAGMVAP